MVSVSAEPRRPWLAPRLPADIVARPEVSDRLLGLVCACVALPDGTGISAGSAGGAVYTFDLVGR